MRLAVLLGLLACNAIWAMNPIMGKFLLQSYAPFQLAQLRYGAAFLTAGLVVLLFRAYRPARLSSVRTLLRGENFIWIFALGMATFFISPILQYLGLIRGTATANSLVVAVEPLFAALLAWIFLGEKLNSRQRYGFVLALAGFLLLSNLKPHSLSESISLFSLANLYFLAVMPLEALYTIISRRVAGRIESVSLFAGSISLGFLLLSAYLWIAGEALPDLSLLADWRIAMVLFVMGPLGTAITYIYWSEALVEAPVAAVALTLLAQPILGAFAGYFFLDESLDLWQALGAALILAALALQTFHSAKEKNETSANRK